MSKKDTHLCRADIYHDRGIDSYSAHSDVLPLPLDTDIMQRFAIRANYHVLRLQYTDPAEANRRGRVISWTIHNRGYNNIHYAKRDNCVFVFKTEIQHG